MGTTRKRPEKTRIRGKQAVLRLDPVFYPQSALLAAREAFSQLAHIEISKSGRTHLVKFSKMSAAAAKQVPDEFANYALSRAVVEE